MVLDTSLLNTQHYKVCIKGKVEQFRERSSALSYTSCSSYWKGSLLVALDYGRQLIIKLKGWKCRVNCVAGMLEGCMSTCNVYEADWRCDHKNLLERLKQLYNQDFNPKGTKAERFQKSVPFNLFGVQLKYSTTLSLSLSSSPVHLDFKKGKEKTLIIYYTSMLSFSAIQQ